MANETILGLVEKASSAIPITPLTKDTLPVWLDKQTKAMSAWVKRCGFTASPGSHCLLPAADGTPDRVLVGFDPALGPWALAGFPASLPQGCYSLDAKLDRRSASDAALGWALGSYRFTRYKAAKRNLATLIWPAKADRKAVERTAEATNLVRDLVNTPAADMGPGELAAAAKAIARQHKAKFSVIEGDELLKKGYPAIHAVGRASVRAPRLIDFRWGNKGPRIVVVGKGVCFDTGGLDLKPSGGMKLMKKDMGGAAHALGLAQMIMAANLPVRLRVLVPAVENSVSGDAYRPLDVLETRKGLTIEIGNTDAEGRVILCDALAEAGRDKLDLLVDFATLTGAARVALGPELPALFANDDRVAEALLGHGLAQHDPLWRLPLHKPYRALLDSKVADLNTISEGGFAGSITAALFLAEFVDPATPWIHLDLMAWNVKSRPGRPEGGEAMSLRAVYALIEAMTIEGKSKPKGKGARKAGAAG